jgi:RHS repeat-associated protein
VFESPAAEAVLPEISANLNAGETIKQGIMNQIYFTVQQTAGANLSGVYLQITSQINGTETIHTSDSFNLSFGQSQTQAVVIPGYMTLEAGTPMAYRQTMLIKPNANEEIRIIRNQLQMPTGSGKLLLEVENGELARGTLAPIKFILTNTGSALMEALTAMNHGVSTEITLSLLDWEENVLSVAQFKQQSGSQIINKGSHSILRLDPGAVFTSNACDLFIPENAPDKAIIRCQIKKFYYHYGETDQVTLENTLTEPMLQSDQQVNLTDTAYYAEITDITPPFSSGNQEILLSGQAIARTNLQPLANVPVKLVISVSGFKRHYTVTTDENGQFVYTFKPMADESGSYSAWALHPDLVNSQVQGTFTIGRAYVSPTVFNLRIPKNYTYTMNFQLVNGPGITLQQPRLVLTGFDALPPGISIAGLDSNNTLKIADAVGPNATVSFPVTITANNQVADYKVLKFKVVSNQFEEKPWGFVTINGTFVEAKPALYFSPNYLETSCMINEAVTETITLENRGFAAMENVTVQVIDRETGNPISFDKSAEVSVLCNFSPDLGTIQPGEKIPLSLTFVSNSADGHGHYNYYLRILSSNYPATDIFMSLRVVSDQQGKILFKVSDLYTGTYNKFNQFIWGVQNAKILIQNDDDYLETWTGYTDEYGELLTDNLTAGSYKCRISTANHQPKVVRLWVKPGITQSLDVFLEYNLVTIEWEVVETTIKDVYTVILKFVFQTDVPAPVLTTNPPYVPLDLNMKPGDVFNVEYELTNHGLIRADNIKVTLPPNDSYFDYQMMSGIPESLGAKQSIKISYRMICKKSVLSQDGSRAGGGSYQGCVGNSHYTITNCPTSGYAPHCVGGSAGGGGGIGGGGGSGGSGGGGSGGGGGGGSSYYPPSNQVITADECEGDPEDESGCDCYSGGEGGGGECDEGGSAVHLVKGHYFDAAADLTVKVPGGEASVVRRFYKKLRPRNTLGMYGGAAVGSRNSASLVVYNPLKNPCQTHGSSSLEEGFVPGKDIYYDYNWYWDHAVGCSMEKIFTSSPLAIAGKAGEVYYDHGVNTLNFNGQTYTGSGTTKLFSEKGKNSGLLNQYNLYKVYKQGSSTIRLIDDQFDGWIESLKWRWENKNGDWREMNFHGKVIASGNKTNALVTYQYNDQGYLTGVFDRNGRQVFWYYYEQQPGLISKIKDCYGREISYQYASAEGRVPQGYPAALLAKVKGSDGYEVNYGYQGDKLVSKSFPQGYQVNITYQSSREKTIIGGAGRTEQTDNNSRPGVAVVNFDIAPSWRVASIKDNQGNGKTYEYAREKLQDFDYQLNGASAKVIALAAASFGSSSGSSSGSTAVASFGGNKSNKLYYRKITSTRGNVVEYWFDRNYQLIKKKVNGDPADRIIRDGRTQHVFDANGNHLVKYYDEWDNLTKTEYEDGSFEKYVYDGEYHQLIEETNVRGVKTKYEYDAADRSLIKIIEAWGTAVERTTVLTYNELGYTETISRLGDSLTQPVLISLTYDNPTGNVTSVTDGENHIIHFANHDAQGNPGTIRMKAADGTTDLIWQLEYYHDGELKRMKDPQGLVTEYIRDVANHKLTAIDAENKHTEYSFDVRGNLKQILQKLADNTEIKTLYQYSFDGLLLAMTDAENKQTTYEYDKKNRLIKTVDGNGNVIAYTYNNDQTTDPNCSSCQKGTVSLPKRIDYPTHYVELEYDLRGRETKASGFKPDGSALYSETTQYVMDSNNNYILTVDRLGRESRQDYDDLDRLIKETRFVPGGSDEITRYTYDNRDNLVTVTDANNQITRFEYDRNDRLIKEIRPLNQTICYEYQANGLLKKMTDAKQQWSYYTYDHSGRLTNLKMHQADGTVERSTDFTYNKTGYMTGYSDGLSSASYTYDNLYRKTSETVHYGQVNGSPWSLTHQYSYYKNNKIKSFTYPTGETYEYTYDNSDLLRDVQLPANQGLITANKYKHWQPEEITYPGGAKKQFEYDELLRLTRLSATDSGNNSFMDFSYAFDAMNQIQSRKNQMSVKAIQNLQPGEKQNYSYDKLYRLTEVHKVLADGTTSESQEGFTYDTLGNRLSHAQGTVTSGAWSYNANNELLGYDALSFAYDANGSMTGKLVNNTVVMSFDYNTEDRLAMVKDGSGNSLAAYYYDPFGRRLWKDVSGVRTYFHYADQGLVAEYNHSGQLNREYGYHPDSIWGTDPLFQKCSGQYYYYHNDHLGTPLKMTAASGQTVWEANYSAFGQADIIINQVTNNLRLPGQYYDAETGLHYNFQRYYAPELGRYLQTDPIYKDSLNLYQYAGLNPIMIFDPYGEDWYDFLEGVGNFSAGFADTITFGGTRWIRKKMGTDSYVNKCSGLYKGGEFAGFIHGLAMGGAHAGRNIFAQMGKRGNLLSRLGRGTGRFFYDNRSWGSVRNTWSNATSGLNNTGRHLHHWLFPQRSNISQGIRNAGFNYMPISNKFNTWMNGSTASRRFIERGFRGLVIDTELSPLNSLFNNNSDCSCK